MQRQAGLPLKANTMHTIASILLSVLGIYSPADVAGLPTHLYKNFTVQELALKLKGKNQEFCLTAFMPGRSLVRACLSDAGHEHDTWFDTMLGFAISAYALKEPDRADGGRLTVSGHSRRSARTADLPAQRILRMNSSGGFDVSAQSA